MFRPNKLLLFPVISTTVNLEMNPRETSPAEKGNKNEVRVDVDLEDALDLAGAGRYQLFHCSLMLFTLISAILEMIGIAFILPAAACDLDVPDSLKGIITSIPNIGVILTAPFWGRAADSMGRKPVLLAGLAGAGLLGIVAALMPTLLTFALCKLAGSLFLSVPSSLGYAYASELLPRRRRDSAVLICNALVNLLTVLCPVIAWVTLSFDWRYQLGALSLRPWRLLTAIYAAPLVLAALWMTSAVESPKFLLTKGKDSQALAVVRQVYACNYKKSEDSFSVKSLKSVSEPATNMEQNGSAVTLERKGRSESGLALLRAPHFKWLALTGFLMFGVFSFLNGLFLLTPDTINKMMTGSEEQGTVCELTSLQDNTTTTEGCVDSISRNTFQIMAVTTLVYGILVTVASVSPLSKKTLLVSTFLVVGAGCLIAGLTTNRIVAGIAMSSLQITALGIGPLTAYVVYLFPTTLRATAVGAVMMMGRAGSVVGANAAGVFLSVACTPTFYGFSALVFLCAGLSFLLPADNLTSRSTEHLDRQTCLCVYM